MSRFRQSRDGVERCNVHAVARLNQEVYEALLRVWRESGVKNLKTLLSGFLVDAIAEALASQEEEESYTTEAEDD